MSPIYSSVRKNDSIRRLGILFAGGPAPAANAVISTASAAFLRNGIHVTGILNGYSNLANYSPENPLQVGLHYRNLDAQVLKRTRNSQGIMIGTARTNPGKDVSAPAHLDDPERCAPLRRVYEGLRSLEIDALVSIGGDDTLKTANKLKLYQDRLPADAPRIPIAHLPKTIDNDYMGIDFTFGYFTAVEFLASELRNLIFDAEASSSYFLCEVMGRSAGWLAYGSAIAGEASLVVSLEDIKDEFAAEETYVETHAEDRLGETVSRKIMNLESMLSHMVRVMLARERDGKMFGVIVLAEGLSELLPRTYLEGIQRDEHGHISIAEVNLGPQFAKLLAKAYHSATGRNRRVKGLQLGYESRCAKPHAFDVMLGSQLGVGAYRALVEEGLDGVMVSVSGQLDLHYVNFDQLINPETLVTTVRHIRTGSDFHRLARFMETHVNE